MFDKQLAVADQAMQVMSPMIKWAIQSVKLVELCPTAHMSGHFVVCDFIISADDGLAEL